ncbi:(Fe-S)-binding protein [Flavobacteriaceae bacterium]|nr:(Fe-S)-binding protein [Flavobacteriaceae bacterium]MDC0874474.1 (Fe-S)-binding protein [Flavobacteriaceae bacterium]
MNYIPNIIFLTVLLMSIGVFARNIKRIIRNISLGKSIDRKDQSGLRWKNMFRVALGQSKMVSRPIAGFLHVIVYVGFVLINIELLEIIVDGLTGAHRIFAPILGGFYNVLTAIFEVLALLVLIAVIFFWSRRNISKIKRFWKAEMKGWPKLDADIILYFEVVLMVLFLSMNATDSLLQELDPQHYINAGSFPVSAFIVPLFDGFSMETLHIMERSFWWLHIIGIFIFLNYLYYSKHLHILLAFPNTYFANLNSKGKFPVDSNIKNEVQLMMDPNFAIPDTNEVPPEKFGASDVFDLNWIQLMNAYSCTECGRCSSVCPANLTGKKLSPRKIMMDTRDRLEEVGKSLNKNKGVFEKDSKQLLNDYITPEELWACTSCNACVDACPIEIDPLSIIMDMRQYLVMEQSAAPQELNAMMGNIENNGAPWPFSNQDRLQWANE